MTVSIIVAVKGDNPYLRECIQSCLKLDYPDFEILVLPDKPLSLDAMRQSTGEFTVCHSRVPLCGIPLRGKSGNPDRPDYSKIRIIPTGEVTPPIKRDMALEPARGEILAFLDDDAYPVKDWLTKALVYFSDPQVAAVGGPAVTPDSDDLWQEASGRVYSSWAMAGEHRYRYIPGEKREVEDYPSCNFLVRKSAMRRIGGFATRFWPGEDTFFCLKIVRDLKEKIVYAPDVLVYHHRRRLFRGHLKQIANYGLHRGYFAKRFPETSRKLAYFLPSVLVLGLLSGALVPLIPAFKWIYFPAIISYLTVVFISSISNPFRLTLLVFWGIIFSHIVYGIYFIKGLFSEKLSEE